METLRLAFSGLGFYASKLHGSARPRVSTNGLRSLAGGATPDHLAWPVSPGGSGFTLYIYIYIYVAWTFMYSLAISFVLNTNIYICLLFFVLLKV